MVHYFTDTPLGWFRLSGTDHSISRAEWVDEEEAIISANAGQTKWAREAERQLGDYFNGKRQRFKLPLHSTGSPFQMKVWQHLSDLEYGYRSTYLDIARLMGGADKARAVGTAIGQNPLLLIVPCHRVVGSNGSLSGYAAGIERKEWLLNHEGAYHAQQLRLF